MSRDYTKLQVFGLADELVIDVYALARVLPDSERYGLQSQLRRAAVSVPTNIVEGSVRRTDRAYLKYLETSLGSACEVRYLLRLATRLRLLDDAKCRPLQDRYGQFIRQMESLMKLVAATARREQSSRRRRRREPIADSR